MSQRTRRGITLIELIVVCAIIALLMALTLPAVRRVREPANRMLCASNLRQLMIATHNYHNDTGRIPKGCLGSGTSPDERLSWMVSMLPYLESDALFKNVNVEKGYAGNRLTLDKKMKMFLCPAATEELVPITHYVALAGVGVDAPLRPEGVPGNGFMGYDRQTTFGKITAGDGTSNTIGMMETRADLGHWARGGSNTLRGYDPETMRLGGITQAFSGHVDRRNAAMLDGSIRMVHNSVDPKVLSALLTIAGHERVDTSDAFVD